MISLDIASYTASRDTKSYAFCAQALVRTCESVGLDSPTLFSFTGFVCRADEDIDRAAWNPQNVYSLEHWVEADLYLCQYTSDDLSPMSITSRRSIARCGSDQRLWRFFLPKDQLREFYDRSDRSGGVAPSFSRAF